MSQNIINANPIQLPIPATTNGNGPEQTRRSRGWCFTWNNYPVEYRSFLDAIDCRYVIAGEELAPTTNTPHLQGYIYFQNARTQRVVRGLLPGCHLLVARGTATENKNYCCKTRPEDRTPNENVYERGVKPVDPSEKGAMERARYEDAWAHAKLGEVEQIDADIRLRLYSSIRRIEKDFMPAVARLDAPCGIWIYGLSGSGKSRSVLDAYPLLYPKPRNNWWDGYQREPVVLVDDVDKFDVALGGKLKHWADCYPFIGEAKGTSLKIRPSKLFVTSQYKIEEIWHDEETREALGRRFRVIEKLEGQNIII